MIQDVSTNLGLAAALGTLIVLLVTGSDFSRSRAVATSNSRWWRLQFWNRISDDGRSLPNAEQWRCCPDETEIPKQVATSGKNCQKALPVPHKCDKGSTYEK